MLVLDGCVRLQHVEPEALSKSLESFSFDGFGQASRWKNLLQMPEKELRRSACLISLEGCA